MKDQSIPYLVCSQIDSDIVTTQTNFVYMCYFCVTNCDQNIANMTCSHVKYLI